MLRRSCTILLVLALVVGLSGPASHSAPVPGGCTDAAPAAAAASLVGPDAAVAGSGRTAGFQTLRVAEPITIPPVEHLLVRSGGMWCHAVRGFDHVWETDARGGAVARASAFARLSGTTWFGDVTVRSAAEVVPGLVKLQTHGSRNGVVADWTVHIDRRGIREASWTALRFGVRPFEPSLHGVTALPGASRSFIRTRSGLRLDGPVLRTHDEETTINAEAVMSDGMRIRIRNGDLPAGVALDRDTGLRPVDIIRFVRTVTEENYETMLAWGLEGRWPYRLGNIYVDGSNSLFCLACVYLSGVFNIHISSQVVHALSLLGYSYPDDDQAFSLVIGHEMFHNFQMGYMPSLSRYTWAFVEGSARFQETLHPYAAVTHQPHGLTYGSGHLPSSNTCNDFMRRGEGPAGLPAGDPDAVMAGGPIAGHTYDSCAFWISWYATHGIEGLVSLMEAGPATTSASWSSFAAWLERSTGQDVEADLVAFAAAMLSGRGLTWAPAAGDGPALDWGMHLNRWQAPNAGPVSRFLRAGGAMALEVTGPGSLSVSAPVGVETFLVHDDGLGSTTHPVQDGATLQSPPAGHRTWVVAVQPETEAVSVELAVQPL